MSTQNSESLSGKVAIITGGTKGIGRATALALSKAGASVVVNYAADSGAAEQLVSEIGSDKAYAVRADASSLAGGEKLINAAVEKFGKIDILIPNAGTMPLNTIEQIDEKGFDHIFAMNVKGPLFMIQKAIPHMSSGSRIILVSTTQTTASTVTPNYLLYNATKGAIEQIVRCLSKELAAKEITVNSIAPGPTGTDLFLKGKSEQVVNMIAGFNPHKRIGKPEEIADVMAFLSGEGSRWITGQNLRVNGGMA